MSNLNQISELVRQIENRVSIAYFFAQLLTIICLFLYGLFFLTILSDDNEGENGILKAVLAYPMGLAVFSVVAILMVTFAIPYNTFSVLAGCLIAGISACFLTIKVKGKDTVKARLCSIRKGFISKQGIIIAVIVIIAAVISCLGIFSIIVSNDSIYRYSFYPRAIVHFGGLRVNYDTFLTDLGQGYVLINSLPFLFGFNEPFGLQEMLNLSFVALFVKALLELFKDQKKWIGYILSAVIVLLLISSMPYELISKWILSNDYFSVFLFITCYLALKGSKEETGNVAILSIFVTALSIMRIEGGVYAALLIMCISTLKYTGRELGLYITCPVIFIHCAYSARIFLTMNITAAYSFLTPQKAIIMIALLIFVLLYLLFIRGRLPAIITEHLGLIIILGVFGLNVLLLIVNPAIFLDNLKCFVENILYSGGWSIIPVCIFSIYLISLCCNIKRFKFNYWDMMAFSYLLYSIAVTFMRDGGLRTGVGDSGNRVLMQCISLLLYAAVSHLPGVLSSKNADKDV